MYKQPKKDNDQDNIILPQLFILLVIVSNYHRYSI